VDYTRIETQLDEARHIVARALNTAIDMHLGAGPEHQARADDLVSAMLYYRDQADAAWAMIRQLKRGEEPDVMKPGGVVALSGRLGVARQKAMAK
jgi:hypothetical protein